MIDAYSAVQQQNLGKTLEVNRQKCSLPKKEAMSLNGHLSML